MLAGLECEGSATIDDLVCSLFAVWVGDGEGDDMRLLDRVFGGLWGEHVASAVSARGGSNGGVARLAGRSA